MAGRMFTGVMGLRRTTNGLLCSRRSTPLSNSRRWMSEVSRTKAYKEVWDMSKGDPSKKTNFTLENVLAAVENLPEDDPARQLTREQWEDFFARRAGPDGTVDFSFMATQRGLGVSLHQILESKPDLDPESTKEWFDQLKDEETGQVYVNAKDVGWTDEHLPDIKNGDFLAAIDEFVPNRAGWEITYLMNPKKRKKSKYPVPPVADCPGIILPASLNPAFNPHLPYTLDRSEGVTVIKFKEGHPYHDEGEMVLGAMQMSLEWVLPSPPPLHTFDEQPIVKQRPSWEDDGSFAFED